MFNELFNHINNPATETKVDDLKMNLEIEKILNNANNIYIGSDFHLLQWWDNKPWKNASTDRILKNYNDTVQPGDAYIFLGDLVSGEITDKDSIRQLMAQLPNGTKIFVRGNNDLFDDDFYKELGFAIICDKFTYKDTVFTHIPIEKADFGPGITKNAHGHIHFSRQYYVRYFNHMDVYTKANRCKPLLLSDMYENLKKGKYKPISI